MEGMKTHPHACAGHALLPSEPVPFTQVRFSEGFWASKRAVNRTVSLFFQYDQLKSSGRIDALRLQWTPGSQVPFPNMAWDSDTAKWVEAASYVMATDPDPKLGALLDEVVGLFVGAQQPDGYLNSYFSVVEKDRRWKNLALNHELYCAGHIFEAAVAYHESTGRKNFLDTAVRYADYIAGVFGREPGKLRGYCGHEEIELALVRLYEATGLRRLLDLADYFVEERGQTPNYFAVERERFKESFGFEGLTFFGDDYFQAHLPVRQQREPVGHAVRAVYLYSAMAELARAKNDRSLFEACAHLWERIAQTRLYLTGQIGSSWKDESFTGPYDLPVERAYCETCAGVALIQWNRRMLRLDCDSRYADQIEQTLYNGALSGMALDGKGFFYQNPLADRGEHRRSEWFGCSCCPSNLSRLLASLGGYVASVVNGGVAVHLYGGSQADAVLPSGNCVRVSQETRYPWEGRVVLQVKPATPAAFELALRVPAWCADFSVRIDGLPITPRLRKGYAVIERAWTGAERVELDLPMRARQWVARPEVVANMGQVALRRGPMVYCLESADNAFNLFDLSVPADAALSEKFEPGLLGGVVALEGRGTVGESQAGVQALYRAREADPICHPAVFRAIPYYAWANRSPGQMAVWLKGAGR